MTDQNQSLTVYSVNKSGAKAFLAHLRKGVRKRKFPFAEVRLFDRDPNELDEPFLMLRTDVREKIWTPVFARHNARVELPYSRGMHVTLSEINRFSRPPDPAQPRSYNFPTCKPCRVGMAGADMDSFAYGILSRDAMTVHTAEEAADLALDVLEDVESQEEDASDTD